MSAWVNQIFQSKIAKRRGYHIVEHGDQWLIICDTASVRTIA
jgi:hypothetical protein